MDDAGARVELDEVGRQDAPESLVRPAPLMIFARLILMGFARLRLAARNLRLAARRTACTEPVERWRIALPDQLRPAQRPLHGQLAPDLLRERRAQRSRHDEALLPVAHHDIVDVRVHRRERVRRQRPRRRRPDE